MKIRYAFPFFFAFNAYAEPITCPDSIDVAPQQVAHEVVGWQPFIDTVNTRMQLESAALYSGKPEKLATLVPDEIDKKHSLWNLNDNGQEKYYLSCRYTHTSVQLTREVPSTSKACRVIYDPTVTIKGYPVPQKVVCQ